ncbi:hypothetical protein DPEC_G00254210 [Dallia pectoralis]|uniref:Uncharacterized protein n=1 Tax=Dallia pectoralis TaxID=75939 RepID=A0ACC2FU70_DALPE|nr:hypothetical protein DPEC_G00254210 [Dallia pectoralis]
MQGGMIGAGLRLVPRKLSLVMVISPRSSVLILDRALPSGCEGREMEKPLTAPLRLPPITHGSGDPPLSTEREDIVLGEDEGEEGATGVGSLRVAPTPPVVGEVGWS